MEKEIFNTGDCVLITHNLFEPEAMEEGKPKRFDIFVRCPKDAPEVLEMIGRIKAKEKEDFKGVKGLAQAVQDGDASEYEDSHGHFVFRASVPESFGRKPRIFEMVDGQVKIVTDPARIHRGNVVRISYSLYSYPAVFKPTMKRGVGIDLQNVFLVEQGEAPASRVTDAQAAAQFGLKLSEDPLDNV